MIEQFAFPLARVTDPGTSHSAAARVATLGGRTERAIHDAFLAFGPMTDDELVARVAGKDSTIKTARSRMTNGPKRLLRDSGQRRPSTSGVPMIVWELR